jgi:DNA-binding MarR family transcriptional regulator
VQRVQLTPTGTQTLAEVRRRKDAWLADQLRALDPEARAHLASALDALEALVRCHDRQRTPTVVAER